MPSPNFDERDAPVDMLVLHYTDTLTLQDALGFLLDPTPGKRVSAHYCVDEDGSVYRIVAEDKRAWHAGVASWRGHSNINARSIGIEIVNPGHSHGYRAFPQAQMDSVVALCKEILARHPIPAWNVVAHSDVAPARKSDPGELFDWPLLAKNAIGMLPKKRWRPDPVRWFTRLMGLDILTLQRQLAAFGYGIECNGIYTQETQAVVTAFQRHYRTRLLNGRWDTECESLLKGLLEKAPAATNA